MEGRLNAAGPATATPLRGALADVLSADRAFFNSHFETARLAHPGLGAEAVQDFLRGPLARIADQLNEAAPARLGATVEALYTFALPLLAQRWLGPLPRDTVLAAAWERVLLGLPAMTATAPERFAAATLNALYNLRSHAGARTDAWADSLVDAGSACDSLDTLLDCGKVLAWTRGLAHTRSGALKLLESLPPSLAGRLFGLDGELTAVMRARLAADAWYQPALGEAPPSPLRLAARIGGFRGFGGPFARPPTIATEAGNFIADDGETRFALHADVFGTTWHALGPAAPLPAAHAGEFLAAPKLPELRGASSSAVLGNTLLVALPWSHELVAIALAA